MDAEKKMVAIFVKLCHSFMKELGMPGEPLERLLGRVGELQTFQLLFFWKFVYASFYALEKKLAKDPIKKPQIPDLNLPAPQDAEAGPSQIITMQDPDAKFVEVEATAVAVTTKRKAAQPIRMGAKGLRASK